MAREVLLRWSNSAVPKRARHSPTMMICLSSSRCSGESQLCTRAGCEMRAWACCRLRADMRRMRALYLSIGMGESDAVSRSSMNLFLSRTWTWVDAAAPYWAMGGSGNASAVLVAPGALLWKLLRWCSWLWPGECGTSRTRTVGCAGLVREGMEATWVTGDSVALLGCVAGSLSTRSIRGLLDRPEAKAADWPCGGVPAPPSWLMARLEEVDVPGVAAFWPCRGASSRTARYCSGPAPLFARRHSRRQTSPAWVKRSWVMIPLGNAS
mmetsp:Transcript_13336/g.28517  ORF Transcript_13336/g.28517 Transcript_13336/m.28517 type:complete len:267 (-) Transcript_13336:355-1155(-)